MIRPNHDAPLFESSKARKTEHKHSGKTETFPNGELSKESITERTKAPPRGSIGTNPPRVRILTFRQKLFKKKCLRTRKKQDILNTVNKHRQMLITI